MSKSAAEIEHDAEVARERLTQTAESLKDKMSPGQIVDEVTNYFGKSNGSEMMSNLGAQVRDNPLPLLLIGAGFAWLAAGGGPGSRRIAGVARDTYDRTADRFASDPEPARLANTGAYPTTQTPPPVYGASSGGTASSGSNGKSGALRDQAGKVADKAGKVADKAGKVADKVTTGLSDAAETVSDAASRARDGASEAASAAGDRIGDAYQTANAGVARASRQARSAVSEWSGTARDGFQRTLREEPLIVGAIGVAVGTAIGAMLPRTRYEDEHIGVYRDRVGKGIAEAAKEGVEEAKDVASDVYFSSKKAAEEEGLTGTPDRPIAEKISKVGKAAAKTAEKKTREKLK